MSRSADRIGGRMGLASLLLAWGGVGSWLPLQGAEGDWPRFRGSGGRGIVSERPLPLKWSDGGGDRNGVRWKVRLPGRGCASPIVARGRVLVTSASGYRNRELHVVCLAAETGQVVWHRRLWATGRTMRNRQPRSCAGA